MRRDMISATTAVVANTVVDDDNIEVCRSSSSRNNYSDSFTTTEEKSSLIMADNMNDDCESKETLEKNNTNMNNIILLLVSKILLCNNSNNNCNSTVWIYLLIVFGICISCGYMIVSINTSYHDLYMRLEKQSSDLSVSIAGTFQQYELTALWIHQLCDNNNNDNNNNSSIPILCSRNEFTNIYKSLQATGLKFQSLSYVPNVTHEQRVVMEMESQQYLNTLQQQQQQNNNNNNNNNNGALYPYYGFTGFQDSSSSGTGSTGSSRQVGPRSDQSFYFPQHYLEPLIGNEFLFDFDIYSSYYKSMIDDSIQNYKPILSNPIKSSTTNNNIERYVLYLHPGINATTETATIPPDCSSASYSSSLSSMAIPFSAILDRVVFDPVKLICPISIYVYDVTGVPNHPATLFGAIQIEEDEHNVNKNVVTTLTPTNVEESWEDFQIINEQKHRMIVQTNVDLPSTTNQWKIVVIPSYNGATIMCCLMHYWKSIFGGSFIILGTFIIFTYCLQNKLYKEKQIRDIRHIANEEKNKLLIESAQKEALAEYQLNEFIAHEVRNPLTAAMSACNFIQSSITNNNNNNNINNNNNVYNNEIDTMIQEDVGVISSSLHYINDLLRSMLDLHKVKNSQLKLHITPTDILTDIFQPVKAMLGLRTDTIQIIIDCPNDLIIKTDRMRLKQIILNLTSNSKKFVKTGYIRMHAYIIDNGYVQIAIEDSGPGIPIEKRNKLFSRYQDSLDALNQGTGMGLHLCESLIHLLNGSIILDESFHSTIHEYQGTRFIINLNTTAEIIISNNNNAKEIISNNFHITAPNSNNKNRGIVTINNNNCTNTVPDDIELGTTNSPLLLMDIDNDDENNKENNIRNNVDSTNNNEKELPENLSVLIVDDEMILRKMLSRSLKRIAPSWSIEQASNGETAIVMATSKHYDLIFMDQYMASIERQLLGTETVRALRVQHNISNNTTRICGLSANHTEDAFIQAGANAFMLKPFPCNAKDMKIEIIRILFDS